MGKKANKNEIHFNYPIPGDLHREIKRLSFELNMPVKTMVVNALVDYVAKMKDALTEYEALSEPHGTDGFDEEL